jgi:hypothetical protein
MTKPTSNSPGWWQQSTIRRFLKWLFSWRTARRALVSLAVLVTLYALFRTEENIRGKRVWDKYRRELEARGAQLDWAAYIPKLIPDDQNFAATPVIQSWFVRSNNVFTSSDYWKKDKYGLAESRVTTDKDHRGFTDLVAWGRAFANTNTNGKVESGPLNVASRAKAAPAVLAALETNEAMFAELRAASQRPYSRYPVNYDVEEPFAILLPHLSSVRNVCRRLQLKACAELAAGRSAEALADVKLMLRLADSIKEDPFLIDYLVRVACLQTAIEPVWEGLAERRWSDAQLQELQACFQWYDFVADLKRPLEVERASGLAILDLIRKHGLGYLIMLDGSGSPSSSDARAANWLGMVLPTSGWLYLEQENLLRGHQTLLDGTIDPPQRRVFPDRTEANGRELDRALKGGEFAAFIRHRVMATLLLPALSRVVVKAATAQTVVDQAALACALERYRLANGQFPDTLDALVPRFISQLPHDVITGEPYKYRRTDDGQFVVYSVGWNEKDDGGVPGKTLFDEKEGDWVWQYPPNH